MRTVAVISQKGGAGKTTLAVALAVAMEQAGLAAVVVDLDPQGSAVDWAALREAETPAVVGSVAGRLRDVLAAAAANGADVAIVDTAPRVDADALVAARASDFVLIPCRPAAPDLRAIGASIALARRADTPCAVVLNAAPVRSPLVTQAYAALGQYGVGVSPAVFQRVAHVYGFTAGLSAAEAEPGGKAAREIDNLADWFRNCLDDIGRDEY